jgi:hypothetical protein
MEVSHISDFKKGWFVGDFEPSIFRNPFFELAHQKHEAGYKTPKHFHKVTTELTYIVKGKMRVGDQILSDGCMFVYEKGEMADSEVIEDVDIVVLRYPSIPTDKYFVK